jgi:hypothetical protein
MMKVKAMSISHSLLSAVLQAPPWGIFLMMTFKSQNNEVWKLGGGERSGDVVEVDEKLSL